MVTTHIVGQLPLSLKTLHIEGRHVVLGLDLLAQCHNLFKLVVRCVEVSICLDLSNCEFLESVSLWEIRKLQTLLVLGTCQPSNLQSLVVYDCEDLVDIPGIDHVIGLKRLHIANSEKLEVPRLLALTKLQVLEIGSRGGVQSLVVDAKDSIPRQLLELSCSCSQSMKGLNLDGFNHLEVLELSYSDGLTSLEEVGELPALRCLNLSYCKRLLRLPNLSKSRNLESLNLEGCLSLELHEKDIQMLSELPLLQSVPFSGEDEPWKFRLDFVRRKVLIHSCKRRHWVPFTGSLWKEHEWEERDLDASPMKLESAALWRNA